MVVVSIIINYVDHPFSSKHLISFFNPPVQTTCLEERTSSYRNDLVSTLLIVSLIADCLSKDKKRICSHSHRDGPTSGSSFLLWSGIDFSFCTVLISWIVLQRFHLLALYFDTCIAVIVVFPQLLVLVLQQDYLLADFCPC